jgi:lipopolysaccharide biosynthesis glycosyltransferase
MTDDKDERIQIITAANQNYIQYLAALLLSIAQSGKKDISVDVAVIHQGISKDTQDYLDSLTQNRINVLWIEPSVSFLREINAPLEFAYCSPHYFRLLTPFVLSGHKRAIYLDADTLILDDLSPLWKTELGEYSVAAVQDYLPHIKDAVANWREMNLNPYAPYFNSGVLVIDVGRWLAQEIPQKVLRICRENQDYLMAQQKWNQYDQYGLNVLFNGNWKQLNRSWNYGSELPPRNAQILHFIGNGKIGLPKCQPVFSRLFFSFLNQTSYKNWNPN